MSAKDIRTLIKDLEAQGFEIRRTTKGHHRVYRDGQPVCTLSGTPSDHRSMKNSIAALKRAGYIPR